VTQIGQGFKRQFGYFDVALGAVRSNKGKRFIPILGVDAIGHSR
jgi:hypothetical protein